MRGTRRQLRGAPGVVVACVLLGAWGCGGDDEDSSMQPEATDGSYEVTLPEGWRDARDEVPADLADRFPNVSTLGFYMPEGEKEVSVAVNVTDPPSTLPERLARTSLESNETSDAALPQIEISTTELTEVAVDGEEAYAFEATNTPNDPKLRTVKRREVHTIHGESGNYTITLNGTPETFEEYLPDFEAILDSWRWVD